MGAKLVLLKIESVQIKVCPNFRILYVSHINKKSAVQQVPDY